MAPEDAIYNKAAECLKVFNDCIESMTSTPWPQDQLDRFNLWAAHGGIFGNYQQHTSMDWRLRERPELVEMILQLLTLLHEYLSAICTLTGPIAGKVIAAVEDTSSQTQSPSFHTSASASSSECSFGLISETSAVVADPIDTMRGKVEQTLSELFRISAAIRSAGMSYRHTKAANFVEWQDGVNLTQRFKEGVERLLRIKKPSPRDYMVKRLIETICLRQRELAYSRRKRVGTSEKEESVKSHVANLPPRSTAGYSRLGGSGSTTSKLTHAAIGASRGKAAQPDTGQPTVYTATYVPTTVFTQKKPAKSPMTRPQLFTIDGSLTNLPPPPEVGERLEFECPYCDIPFEKTKFQGSSWRVHILEDLRPYVCILPDCKTPHALYKNSGSWISHMQTKHKVARWKCVPSCQSIIRNFQTEAEFLAHAENEHKEEFTAEEMLELANIGRYEINRELEVDILLECPICTISFEDKDFLAVYSHIAEDLTEYAWISLTESPHADANVCQKASSKSASVDDGRIGQRRESEIETERMLPWSLWDSDDPKTRSDLADHDADLKPVPDPSDAEVVVWTEIQSSIRNARRERLQQEPDPSQNLLREYNDKSPSDEDEYEDIFYDDKYEDNFFEDSTKPLKFDLYPAFIQEANYPLGGPHSYLDRDVDDNVYSDIKSGHTVNLERLLWVDGYERSSLADEGMVTRQEMTLVVLRVALASHSPRARFSYVKLSLNFKRTEYTDHQGFKEPKIEAWAPFHSMSVQDSPDSNPKKRSNLSADGNISFHTAELSAGRAAEGEIAWNHIIFDEGRSMPMISNMTDSRNGVTWLLKQNYLENAGAEQKFRVAMLISRTSSEPYVFRFRVDTRISIHEDIKSRSENLSDIESTGSKQFLITPWRDVVCNFEGHDIMKCVDLKNMGRLRDQKESSKLDLKWGPGYKLDIPTLLQTTPDTEEEGEEKLSKLEEIGRRTFPNLSQFTKKYCDLVEDLIHNGPCGYRPIRIALIDNRMLDIASDSDNLRDLTTNRQQLDTHHPEERHERFGRRPRDRTLWSRIKEGRSFVNDDYRAAQWFLASDSHGIQMAKIIGSIDPCCEFYVASVSLGSTRIISERVSKAIQWAISKGVDIISMSFVLRQNTGELRDACRQAADRGIAMVCSAYDEEMFSEELYPADFKTTIAITPSSPYGIVLPSGRIRRNGFAVYVSLGTLSPFNSSALLSRSSTATAIAAGLSSLILSCDRLARREEENYEQRLQVRIVKHHLQRMALYESNFVDPETFAGIDRYINEGRDIDFDAILQAFFRDPDLVSSRDQI
ncbi:hypothetical protein GGI35DRAFT_433224 [Trichoderma velutinum]